MPNAKVNRGGEVREDRELAQRSKATPGKPQGSGELSSDELAKVSGGSLLRGNNTDNRKGGRYLAM
jgi:hypothetical protein